MTADWLAILPFIILAVGGVKVYLLGALWPGRPHLLFATALTAAVLCLITAAIVPVGMNLELAGMLDLGPFSRYYTVWLAAICALTLLMIEGYARVRNFANETLYGTILLATLGMIGVACATHWLSFFLSFELLSLSLYILIAARRNQWRSYSKSHAGQDREHPARGYKGKRAATRQYMEYGEEPHSAADKGIGLHAAWNYEAALKYFIMGAVASSFLAFGIALLYSATGSLRIAQTSLTAFGAAGDRSLAVLGLLLIIAGIGFKISLVPFHLWTPDVYEGAPAPVTAFLSTGSKVAMFAVLLRLTQTGAALPAPLAAIFWGLAALTMLTGNLTAMVQQQVKRLLAYSSIAQMGYLFMALLAGGSTGATAVLLYSSIYGLMDLAAFGSLGLMSERGDDLNDLEKFRGLGYRRPWLAAVLAVSLLSLAGLPPLAGFFGKFMIFTAAFQAGYLWLGLIGVFSAVLSIYYYQKVLVALYLEKKAAGAATAKTHWPGAVAGLIAALLLLLIGLLPGPLMTLIERIIGRPPV